jgi:hypothetical protein
MRRLTRNASPKVSLKMRKGKCSAFAPPPASHGTPGGGFIRVVPCVALAHGADWHFEWHEEQRTDNPADEVGRASASEAKLARDNPVYRRC